MDIFKFFGIIFLLISKRTFYYNVIERRLYIMKILSEEVEMIAKFKSSEKPIPIKFIYQNGDEKSIIKVNKILYIDEEKIAGNKTYIYRCQSVLRNTERTYELKYDLNSCKWFLWKM